MDVVAFFDVPEVGYSTQFTSLCVWEPVGHRLGAGCQFPFALKLCVHTANLGQTIQPPQQEEKQLQQQPRNS